MGVVKVRTPTASSGVVTLSDGSGAAFTNVGGANGSASLSDGTSYTSTSGDTTYIQTTLGSAQNSSWCEFHFDDPTVPALAQVTSVIVLFRYNSSFRDLNVRMRDASGNSTATRSFAAQGSMTGGLATYTTAPDGGSWTDAKTDAARIGFRFYGGSATAETPRIAYAEMEVYYNEAPTVSGISPSSGTQTTSKPTISWSYSDPDGDGQDRFAVKIFTSTDAASAGFDPGSPTSEGATNTAGSVTPAYYSGVVFSASTSHTITKNLTNGTAYKAYVWAADSGSNGRYSADTGAVGTFTVSLDPPGNPAITGTVESTATLGPRVKLDLQGRANMLTKNQSTLDTDTTGWVAHTNCTISRITTPVAHSPGALSMVATAAGNMLAATPAGTSGVAVAPSTIYSAMADFRKPSGAETRDVRVSIVWYDSGGATISTTTGSTTTADSTQWRTQNATATSPAAAAFAQVRVEVLNVAISEQWAVDKIGFTPASSIIWTIGGLLPSHTLTLERSEDGGVTWTAVSDSPVTPPATTQAKTIYDYEGKRGIALSYKVTATATNSDGAETSSPSFTVTNLTIATDNKFWLKAIDDPNLNRTIEIVDFATRHPETTFTTAPLGRGRKVVIADTVTGVEFDLTLLLSTSAAYTDLLALRPHDLLLQSDVGGDQWYVRVEGEMAMRLLNTPGRRAATPAPIRFVDVHLIEIDS